MGAELVVGSDRASPAASAASGSFCRCSNCGNIQMLSQRTMTPLGQRTPTPSGQMLLQPPPTPLAGTALVSVRSAERPATAQSAAAVSVKSVASYREPPKPERDPVAAFQMLGPPLFSPAFCR